jgi:hypothetical protein
MDLSGFKNLKTRVTHKVMPDESEDDEEKDDA